MSYGGVQELLSAVSPVLMLKSNHNPKTYCMSSWHWKQTKHLYTQGLPTLNSSDYSQIPPVQKQRRQVLEVFLLTHGLLNCHFLLSYDT